MLLNFVQLTHTIHTFRLWLLEPSEAVTGVSTELVFAPILCRGLPGTAWPPDHWILLAASVSLAEIAACTYTQSFVAVFTAAQFVPSIEVALLLTTVSDCSVTGPGDSG